MAPSNGTFYLENVPSGHMVSSNPAAVRWTAPRATAVTATCIAWNPRNTSMFSLAINRQILAQAYLLGRTFASPYKYVSRPILVNQGDILAVLNGPSGDYMDFDFSLFELTLTSLADAKNPPQDGP